MVLMRAKMDEEWTCVLNGCTCQKMKPYVDPTIQALTDGYECIEAYISDRETLDKSFPELRKSVEILKNLVEECRADR